MHKTRSLKPKLKFILTVLSWTAFVFLLVLGVFLLYYVITIQIYARRGIQYEPPLRIYTIVSPSMEPQLRVFDVIVNRRVDSPEDIRVGNVITFISPGGINPGMRVTHRVVDILTIEGQPMYRTQGDNNLTPDSHLVPFENVEGRLIMHIPQLGRVQFFLATRGGWFIAILVPALALIIYNILRIFKLVGVKKKVAQVLEKPEEVQENEVKTIKEEERKKEIKDQVNNTGAKKQKSIEDVYQALKEQKGEEQEVVVTEEIPLPEEAEVNPEEKKLTETAELDKTIMEIKELEERLKAMKSVVESDSQKKETVNLPKQADK